MIPKIKTIIYATGMGAGAPHVYRYALAMAKEHDAKIIAVSALESLSAYAQSLVDIHIPAAQRGDMQRTAHAQAREWLKGRIARLCEKECENDPVCAQWLSEVRIEDGPPDQVVLRVANEIDADLIIMGSHRHTVIGEVVLGSTTQKVLHKATQPVLVVRIPDGYFEEGF
jgi:nucleotide-binding universal stress UspA family protein